MSFITERLKGFFLREKTIIVKKTEKNHIIYYLVSFQTNRHVNRFREKRFQSMI